MGFFSEEALKGERKEASERKMGGTLKKLSRVSQSLKGESLRMEPKKNSMREMSLRAGISKGEGVS